MLLGEITSLLLPASLARKRKSFACDKWPRWEKKS